MMNRPSPRPHMAQGHLDMMSGGNMRHVNPTHHDLHRPMLPDVSRSPRMSGPEHRGYNVAGPILPRHSPAPLMVGSGKTDLQQQTSHGLLPGPSNSRPYSPPSSRSGSSSVSSRKRHKKDKKHKHKHKKSKKHRSASPEKKKHKKHKKTKKSHKSH